MTKVLMTEYFLAYQLGMKEMVSQIVKEKFIAGVQNYIGEDPALAQVDLLPPPRIEMIDLMIYEGNIDDLIIIATSDDFGIVNVHILIQDEHGNLIERGDAELWENNAGHWNYMTMASVPSGTSVTVHAFATDTLGGIGVLSEQVTIK